MISCKSFTPEPCGPKNVATDENRAPASDTRGVATDVLVTWDLRYGATSSPAQASKESSRKISGAPIHGGSGSQDGTRVAQVMLLGTCARARHSNDRTVRARAISAVLWPPTWSLPILHSASLICPHCYFSTTLAPR